MLSIYETYCDLHNLTMGKNMFLSYVSASSGYINDRMYVNKPRNTQQLKDNILEDWYMLKGVIKDVIEIVYTSEVEVIGVYVMSSVLYIYF